MINAYKDGKDLYAMIASKVYHNNYEDNLEHYPDGSIYEEGKKRRSSVKSLLLGMMYGMGTQSIANAIHGTYKEAQDVLDGFYKAFPKVRKWMDDTEAFAKKYGYVEDWYGRRRRLPDLLLEPYEVKRIKNNVSEIDENFNPFIGCSYRILDDKEIKKYKKQCEDIESKKDYDELKKKAQAEGIEIKSNTSIISAAVRQTVNSRVQGGAATMTKVAMIKIANDEELNRLGFRMLIGVHDELIGECPKEYADEVADRLSYVMKTCIEDYCVVPFKCDAEISSHWYLPSYLSALKKEFKGLVEKNGEEKATELLCNSHTELLKEELLEYIKNGFEED